MCVHLLTSAATLNHLWNKTERFRQRESQSRLDKTYEQCLTCRVSGPHSSWEPGIVVLNYAEGGSGTLSGRGVASWGVRRMDMALGCAPRSALSGLMTALCNRIQTLAHIHAHTHTRIAEDEEIKGASKGTMDSTSFHINLLSVALLSVLSCAFCTFLVFTTFILDGTENKSRKSYENPCLMSIFRLLDFL